MESISVDRFIRNLAVGLSVGIVVLIAIVVGIFMPSKYRRRRQQKRKATQRRGNDGVDGVQEEEEFKETDFQESDSKT